jgi:hypothetical protein
VPPGKKKRAERRAYAAVEDAARKAAPSESSGVVRVALRGARACKDVGAAASGGRGGVRSGAAGRQQSTAEGKRGERAHPTPAG